MQTFHGKTANEVWQQAWDALLQHPDFQEVEGRGPKTNELLHVLCEIQDPTQRWVTSRRPALNPAFAIAEVTWILNGFNDAGFLNHWNARLPDYAGQGTTYHGAYGHRLRHHFGFDQLQQAYRVLQANPTSRQVVLQIWDGEVDFPTAAGKPRNEDIPCNTESYLKLREGQLHWTQLMRSNDIHKGMPYNFVQFTVLQEVLAGWLNLEVGSYCHYSDSLHVYVPDQTRTPVKTQPTAPGPSLALPHQASISVWKELGAQLTHLSHGHANTLSVEKARSLGLPDGHLDLLLVCLAEQARKNHLPDLAWDFTTHIQGAALKQVVHNWFQRVKLPSQVSNDSTALRHQAEASRSNGQAQGVNRGSNPGEIDLPQT